MNTSSSHFFHIVDAFDALGQQRNFLVQKYAHIHVNGENILKYASKIPDEQDREKIFLKNFPFPDLQDSPIKIKSLRARRRQQESIVAPERQKYLSIFLHDVINFLLISTQMQEAKKKTYDIAWQSLQADQIVALYRRSVLTTVRDQKLDDMLGTAGYQGDINPNIQSDIENIIQDMEQHAVDSKVLREMGMVWRDLELWGDMDDIRDVAWQLNFFKKIQSSLQDGYIFTHGDLQKIEKIVQDLESGKVVLLTGDTGSGKTELARFICDHFLRWEQKGYVFVPSSRDLETSDLTVEKIITSQQAFDSWKPNIIVEQEKDQDKIIEKQAKTLVENLEWYNQIKSRTMELAWKDEQQTVDIEKYFLNFQHGQARLVMEYHLMWLLKAAKLGLPLIIDEVNLIRPEVLMSLNDYFTRRVWQEIQLPNALGEIEVKKGFCVIMTGNDPDQNQKNEQYGNRYKFDAATYNRLRTYEKDYPQQIHQTKHENTGDSIPGLRENSDDLIQHLHENEMYGLIVMMVSWLESDIMKQKKSGFEIMKRDFDGAPLKKETFFLQMKNLAIAISYIQRAFAKEDGLVLGDPRFSTLPVKDLIKRKVFSMRNLRDVLQGYKTSPLPLECALYDQFISLTTNRKERYAIVAILSTFGFFPGLVTDDEKASLENIELKVDKLKRESTQVWSWDIDAMSFIAKQDILREYFGSFHVSDEFFESHRNDISQIQSNALWVQEESIDVWEYLGDEFFVSAEKIQDDVVYIADTLSLSQDNLDISLEQIGELLFTLDAVTRYASHHRARANEFQLVFRGLHGLLVKITNILQNPVRSIPMMEQITPLFTHLLSTTLH